MFTAQPQNFRQCYTKYMRVQSTGS